MNAAKAACVAALDECGGVLTGGTGHWEIRAGRVPLGDTHETSYIYTCAVLIEADQAPPDSVMMQTTGRAFGSGSLSSHCSDSGAGMAPTTSFTGIHCWDNLVDGLYGNSNSWIPRVSGDKAGVVLPGLRTIAGIQFARDLASGYSDRAGGEITVEYSRTASGDQSPWSSSTGWVVAGNIRGWAANTRNYYHFSTPVLADGLRITVTSSRTCVDELEIYTLASPPSPPPPSPTSPPPSPSGYTSGYGCGNQLNGSPVIQLPGSSAGDWGLVLPADASLSTAEQGASWESACQAFCSPDANCGFVALWSYFGVDAHAWCYIYDVNAEAAGVCHQAQQGGNAFKKTQLTIG